MTKRIRLPAATVAATVAAMIAAMVGGIAFGLSASLSPALAQSAPKKATTLCTAIKDLKASAKCAKTQAVKGKVLKPAPIVKPVKPTIQKKTKK